MTILAYHNDPKIKAETLAQLQAHYDADEIVKGQYWENGKGCAIGCIAETSDDPHGACVERCGGDLMLYRLVDVIFEGLPNGNAKQWPLRVMGAIRPGADLSLVGWKFLHWLLTDEKVNPGINHPSVKDAVKQCADVLVPLTKGKPVDKDAAGSAANAAESAGWSAGSAESAARSAESAARSAARSAAWSAESAGSAASAAWSAARSAARSAAWSAESAGSAAYVRMADRLIELLEETP